MRHEQQKSNNIQGVAMAWLSLVWLLFGAAQKHTYTHTSTMRRWCGCSRELQVSIFLLLAISFISISVFISFESIFFNSLSLHPFCYRIFKDFISMEPIKWSKIGGQKKRSENLAANENRFIEQRKECGNTKEKLKFKIDPKCCRWDERSCNNNGTAFDGKKGREKTFFRFVSCCSVFFMVYFLSTSQ